MCFRILILAIIFSGAVHAYTPTNSVSSNAVSKIDWESWLPFIAFVESGNGLVTNSCLGPSYGRGEYHVSEIGLKDCKRRHPEWEWITPQHLYEKPICRMIALDLLEWLETCFWNDPLKLYKCLSGYGAGIGYTWRHGICWVYVNLVLWANPDWKAPQ